MGLTCTVLFEKFEYSVLFVFQPNPTPTSQVNKTKLDKSSITHPMPKSVLIDYNKRQRMWQILIFALQANKMNLDKSGGTDPMQFVLIDKTPGSDLKLILQAPSEEIKQNWVTQIRSILDMQGDFLKGRSKVKVKVTRIQVNKWIWKLYMFWSIVTKRPPYNDSRIRKFSQQYGIWYNKLT